MIILQSLASHWRHDSVHLSSEHSRLNGRMYFLFHHMYIDWIIC